MGEQSTAVAAENGKPQERSRLDTFCDRYCYGLVELFVLAVLFDLIKPIIGHSSTAGHVSLIVFALIWLGVLLRHCRGDHGMPGSSFATGLAARLREQMQQQMQQAQDRGK